MNTTTEFSPPGPTSNESPDWSTRAWGRPMIHVAFSQTGNDNLVATAEVRYHGIRLRGIRIYRRQPDGALTVILPQKRFGETVDQVYYFLNSEEREQFCRDLVWAYENGIGRRRSASPATN